MSGRGDLVTNERPLESVRDALAGAYTVTLAGGGEIQVRDELDKLVCRISVLAVPGASWWLTLGALRGYDEDADRIRRALLLDGFLTEEAWRSATVPMQPAERADVVVARVLLRLLAIQDANLPGTLANSHIEFLHDFRVAIRRTRSVLREMRGVFVPEDLAGVRDSFKWLQDQTGATRDLDVHMEEFEDLRGWVPQSLRADLDPLKVLLRGRHIAARRQMEAVLGGERARTLHAEWREILHVLVLEKESERPDAARRIEDLTAARVSAVHRKMVRMGRLIDPSSHPDRYHELRKKGKELRYLLELFAAPLFDPEVVRPLVKALKGLQDVLGLHQDREVQIAELRGIGPDLIREPGGPAALMAIGSLVERLEADAERARGSFAASFAEFASEPQCKLVKEVFST